MPNEMQQTKYVTMIGPQAIKDDGSWTTTEVDTEGYDYATIVFHYGTSDIAMAALAITESDSTGSGHSNVTGLVVGTSENTDGDTTSLPAADDDDGFVVFEIDLKARKRYLDMTATAGDGSSGSYASAMCILSRANVTPTTVSGRGCIEILRV